MSDSDFSEYRRKTLPRPW